MLGTSILTRQDPRRHAAGTLIADIFKARYGAQVSSFPAIVIAKFDTDNRPVCAAGLHFTNDGFFSEQYLDDSAERLISSTAGLKVGREELFEVTSLASRDVRHTVTFVRAIIFYEQISGYGWSFFTLTTRMSRMLSHLGIDLTYLARAERHRIPGSTDWGSYYHHDPCVFAFRNPTHSALPLISKERCHALPL